MAQMDLGQLEDDERLAFFINIFNMLVIHAIIIFGAPQGSTGRNKFFAGSKYNIGGCVSRAIFHSR